MFTHRNIGREGTEKRPSKQERKAFGSRLLITLGLLIGFLAGVCLDAAAQTVYPVVYATTPHDTIEFYNGDNLVRTQVVIAGDHLYEPESPNANEHGDIFVGWYRQNPDGTESLINFVGGVPIVESVSGTKVRVEAKYETYYYATFRDQENRIFSRLGVPVGSSLTTEPTLVPELPTQNFLGWSTTPGSSSADDAVSFPVALTQDTVFYPIIQEGYHIHFDANRIPTVMDEVNVTYTPPIFVTPDEFPEEPEDPVADIAAITFGGWYTDPECQTPFEWTHLLTSDTTLYAKWIPGNAQYTVIIWTQNVKDDKNADVDDRHWDFLRSYTGYAPIGSVINYNDLRYAGNAIVNTGNNYISDIDSVGFTKDTWDNTVSVKADGSATLNVYYRRDLMVIRFIRNNNVWRTITGLYGATFAESVGPGENPDYYKWPANYVWKDASMAQTLLTAFTQPENPYTLTSINGSTSTNIYHVRQKVDGSWPTNTSQTELVDLAKGSGGTFYFSKKYENFNPVGYEKNIQNGVLHGPGTQIITTNVSNYSNLVIYHERAKYPLIFYDGNVQKHTESVYYEAPLAQYSTRTLTSTDPTRFVFGGWALTPGVTDASQAVDLTEMEMPGPSLRLYAIWVSIACNVQLSLGDNVIDANKVGYEGPATSEYAYMDIAQSRSFWPTYAANIDNTYMMNATRPGYTLLGWFDENDNMWDFSTGVTKDVCDEGPLYDSLYKNWYYILHLKAKWRMDANIYVKYDLNGGTAPADMEFNDDEVYVQHGNLVVLPGQPLPPIENNGLVYYFTGWADRMGHVHQPGTTFTLDDEQLFTSDPSNPTTVYLELTAQYSTYVPKATLTYYPNYPLGADCVGANAIEFPGHGELYGWRDAVVTLETAASLSFSCTNYTFLGWSRTQTGGVDLTGGAEALVSAMNTTIDPNTNIGNSDLYAVWVENLTLDNSEVCVGEPLVLPSTTDAGRSGTWSVVEPSTATIDEYKLLATAPGEYTIAFTLDPSYTVDDAHRVITKTVTVKPAPTVELAYTTPLCAGETVTITPTVTGATRYSWEDNPAESDFMEGTPSALLIPNAPVGTINRTLTLKNDDGCVASATAAVTVNPVPDPPVLSVENKSNCTGANNGSIKVTSPTGNIYTYSKDNANFQNNNEFSNLDAGYYTITVKNNAGCTSSNSVSVAEHASFTINAQANPASLCAGKNITLSAKINNNNRTYSYNWSGPGDFSYNESGSTSSCTTIAVQSGEYVVTATRNGCSAVAIITVTVNASPTVTMSDASVCQGEGAVATVTAVGSPDVTQYRWKIGNGSWGDWGTTDSQSYSPSTTGTRTYTVQVQNETGCVSETTATAQVMASPTVTASAEDNTICAGNTIVLHASGADTYTWSGPSDFTSVTSGTQPAIIMGATTAHSGTYIVTGTVEAGCEGTGQVQVTVNPSYNQQENLTICQNDLPYTWRDTTFKIGTESGTYTFHRHSVDGCDSVVDLRLSIKNATHNVYTQTVCGRVLWHGHLYTESGTYVYDYINSGGCQSQDVLHLTVNPLPTVDITGELAFCEGGSTTLTATPATGVTYLWSTEETTSSITANAAGTYRVTVTDGNECQSTKTVKVTEKKTTTYSDETTICANELPYTFHGHQFNAAGTQTATVPSVVTGCDSTWTLTVHVNPLPTVDITGELSFCEGGSTTLTATPATGVTYLWNTEETTSSITANAAGTYTVTVTDGNECQSTKTVEVTVKAKPEVNASDVTACQGDADVTVTASGADTYAWNSEQGSATYSVNTASATSYTLTVTGYTDGCASDPVTVNVTVKAKPEVNASDVTACQGDADVTVTASGADTYAWNGEQGSATYSV
ncbi:MAG: InlB B-repeat-containing protein, partial [Bacteroidales bacterium]|nr:InlB B-repeat-containing protein [Bacteroidales bacterium]